MTPNYEVTHWETKLLSWLADNQETDPAHDVGHLRRVLRSAKKIAASECVDPAAVVAAALLHDCVNVPKSDPQRSKASLMSADRAVEILSSMGFPAGTLPIVHHAIRAHSYSAKVQPQTIVAKIVQDADRIDALGAIGIARCFSTSGSMGRTLFHPEDPDGLARPLDDTTYGLDHFKTKLLSVHETMQTDMGKHLARERTRYMEIFFEKISVEVLGLD